jgi:hypothetical protein
MKRYIQIILILFCGCDNQPKAEILTGDLYFSFFRPGSFYNQPDSLVKTFQTYFDTLTIENAGTGDKILLTQYNILKEKDLLYQPFIYLKTDLDSVVTLYLNPLNYEKIKVHKRQKLQDEKKKVRIEASVTSIDNGLFYCTELKHVDIVDGETLQRQKKWKIEDYN